jgi:hypothetical protein
MVHLAQQDARRSKAFPSHPGPSRPVFCSATVLSVSRVERWRGGTGDAYQLPTLSVVGASLASSCPVSTPPLIEPDIRNSRIRLSDWLHLPAHEGFVGGGAFFRGPMGRFGAELSAKSLFLYSFDTPRGAWFAGGWHRPSDETSSTHARVGRVGLVPLSSTAARVRWWSVVVPHDALCRVSRELDESDGNLIVGDRFHMARRESVSAPGVCCHPSNRGPLFLQVEDAHSRDIL